MGCRGWGAWHFGLEDYVIIFFKSLWVLVLTDWLEYPVSKPLQNRVQAWHPLAISGVMRPLDGGDVMWWVGKLLAEAGRSIRLTAKVAMLVPCRLRVSFQAQRETETFWNIGGFQCFSDWPVRGMDLGTPLLGPDLLAVPQLKNLTQTHKLIDRCVDTSGFYKDSRKW